MIPENCGIKEKYNNPFLKKVGSGVLWKDYDVKELLSMIF